ncbi:MAG: hypothetical protein VW438_06190 [Euryarchaeota archaeon]|jgi:hypothetical protein
MAFSGNFMCTSFKKELLFGVHDFDLANGDTFNIALYTNSASFDASTTAYTATNEVSGTGYSAGGQALTNVDPTTSGTTAFTDFADETWTTATITARGALIYNTTPNTTSISVTNPTVVVLDFGGDKTSTAGDFTVVFPTADASNAIIRIA